jgi:hypothetical protein
VSPRIRRTLPLGQPILLTARRDSLRRYRVAIRAQVRWLPWPSLCHAELRQEGPEPGPSEYSRAPRHEQMTAGMHGLLGFAATFPWEYLESDRHRGRVSDRGLYLVLRLA